MRQVLWLAQRGHQAARAVCAVQDDLCSLRCILNGGISLQVSRGIGGSDGSGNVTVPSRLGRDPRLGRVGIAASSGGCGEGNPALGMVNVITSASLSPRGNGFSSMSSPFPFSAAAAPVANGNATVTTGGCAAAALRGSGNLDQKPAAGDSGTFDHGRIGRCSSADPGFAPGSAAEAAAAEVAGQAVAAASAAVGNQLQGLAAPPAPSPDVDAAAHVTLQGTSVQVRSCPLRRGLVQSRGSLQQWPERRFPLVAGHHDSISAFMLLVIVARLASRMPRYLAARKECSRRSCDRKGAQFSCDLLCVSCNT